jgi:hypothetical protein
MDENWIVNEFDSLVKRSSPVKQDEFIQKAWKLTNRTLGTRQPLLRQLDRTSCGLATIMSAVLLIHFPEQGGLLPRISSALCS